MTWTHIRSTLRASRRTFATFRPLQAKSVTKKKYGELPTQFLRSDGLAAAPLEKLEIQSPKARSSALVPKVYDVDTVDDAEETSSSHDEGIQEVEIVSEVDTVPPDGEPADASSQNDVVTPPKRKRRRSKVNDTENNPEGREEASVSKPKTRKRKASGTVKKEGMTGDGTSGVVMESEPSTAIPQTFLAREIHENMTRFPHCMLLTRVGQFYESYFYQAPILASLLNIKLTSRAWGQKGSRVPMCGFPLSHLDRHLKVLVQQNKKFVAMCEEFPRGQGSSAGFDRRVTRVVTPGTLIDESFLNQYENNYLLAIGRYSSSSETTRSEHDEYGLAWIDISTGEFFTQPSSFNTLRNDVSRISPREVVLDDTMHGERGHAIRQVLGEEIGWVSYIRDEPGTTVGDVIHGAVSSGEVVPELEQPDSVGLVPSSHGRSEARENPGPTRQETDVLHSVHGAIITAEGDVPRTESDDIPADPTFTPIVDSSSLLSAAETTAVSLMTSFLRSNLLELMPRLSAPIREAHEKRMQIDSHTIRALEIREGIMEGGVTGSLLSIVKRTVTTSGTRLLARWLCSPSTSIPQIEARQSLVALFHARPHLRQDITELLHRIEDASRIVQKFLLGRGDADDLLAIKDTINVTLQVKLRLAQERDIEMQARSGEGSEEWHSMDILMGRMRDLRGLAQRIDAAVDESQLRRQERANMALAAESADALDPENVVEETPSTDIADKSERNAWTIKPQYSSQLEQLHERLENLRQQKDDLEIELKRNFSAPSLQLRLSHNHGLHIRIGNPKRDLKKISASKNAVLIGQSASSRAYFYPAWSQLGAEIADTEQAIQTAERRAFETLRSEVNTQTIPLRRNARIIDEIDVTIGFATVAAELRLVKPTMNESTSYCVTNGRHPTVELGLLDSGRVFTPNSVMLSPVSRLHLITGPNMAGKSTLLRQTALIAILAQTGAFVPADRADIGIVDKVFSRVGAKDDLFRDRSTFMVEMLETAEILRSATDKSLVIMDEVGRGTTVTDGLAIAFATVNHLYNVNKCRALFATHFHEIADMLGFITEEVIDSDRRTFPHIGFFCTDVDEIEDGRFAYSHRLRPGVNRDSHGLKVARLGGMPEEAMSVATEALHFIRARKATMGSSEELRDLGEALAEKYNGGEHKHITSN